jgi:hypothetical protein
MQPLHAQEKPAANPPQEDVLAKTAQSVQEFIVRWLPLVVGIGLVVVCILLAGIEGKIAVLAGKMEKIDSSLSKVSNSLVAVNGTLVMIQLSLQDMAAKNNGSDHAD